VGAPLLGTVLVRSAERTDQVERTSRTLWRSAPDEDDHPFRWPDEPAGSDDSVGHGGADKGETDGSDAARAGDGTAPQNGAPARRFGSLRN
jgi:hypothetical protein